MPVLLMVFYVINWTLNSAVKLLLNFTLQYPASILMSQMKVRRKQLLIFLWIHLFHDLHHNNPLSLPAMLTSERNCFTQNLRGSETQKQGCMCSDLEQNFWHTQKFIVTICSLHYWYNLFKIMFSCCCSDSPMQSKPMQGESSMWHQQKLLWSPTWQVSIIHLCAR